MNKKAIFIISIAVNILLGLMFITMLPGALSSLQFEYVEQETIRPDSIRDYLEREDYGIAASLSRPIRGGADIAKENADYFILGEYAELMFLKEVFAKAGNADTVRSCEDRISAIRNEMSEYGVILDKIDQSVTNAVRESK
ncbi:MAG: hypothetical protein K5870_11440 [Lachnospiraceae bacterium]|nr:hypothetical protein [Lachnospiraceae bacterium]